ncbi:MAG TPA: twin-arginine translocation signal domain-containing protein [Burkholderiales bacterium]|nr:twin-arginine translocation signal domain-containing protein [Burkholderiales bacterium]
MSKTRVLSRRNFLLTVGAGGAASAAAIVARKSGMTDLERNKGDKRATRGYHAGEHIRNYYRTTKV